MSMQSRIKEKLDAAFSPQYLEVINESHLHTGHSGDDGSGESHFKIIIQSNAFDTISRVARERMIHQVLADEIALIHAISIQVQS